MPKPIIDKAEVAIDFPDKYYYGTFSRSSSYDVIADEAGLHIILDRHGDEPRHVGFHIHYYLLAGILDAAASSILECQGMPQGARQHLVDASKKLANAIENTE